MTSSLFLRHHGLYPLLAFAIAATTLAISGGDLAIADWLYSLEGHQWALRDHPLTSAVMHKGANKVVVGAGVLLVLTALASLLGTRLKPLRKPLWYLLIAMLASTLIVGIGKHISPVDCPWDVSRYGGDHPYIPYFAPHSNNFTDGHCFPAGHAGSGYAFLALYFFLREVKPQWAQWGLAVGLSLGILFGATQQLRGAHFLSHDLWTLALCWFTALLSYLLFFRAEIQASASGEAYRRQLA